MSKLPDPRLTMIYRLEASLGQPLELGTIIAGHRRIVPLIDGTFSGPKLSGTLLPGTSADWQIVLPDGTASATSVTPCRPSVAICSMCSHEACATVARGARTPRGGEDVDASDYTFLAQPR